MSGNALRIYTAVIATLCAAAIAFALYQQQQSARWRQEAADWRTVARQSLLTGHRAVRRERRIAIRYNHLVRQTTRSQRHLLDQLRQAASRTPATVYRTAATGGVAPTAVSTAPAPVAAPAPTTRTS